ncbi:unnamed protein product [Citrullus colocynthis]|uniref:Uncharacterized protein n=1 Tax=Citrullus colocynthis TaxID=252529 RepID=A0ABP0YI88_9ROSI
MVKFPPDSLLKKGKLKHGPPSSGAGEIGLETNGLDTKKGSGSNGPSSNARRQMSIGPSDLAFKDGDYGSNPSIVSYSDDDTFMSTPMSEKEGEVTTKGL